VLLALAGLGLSVSAWLTRLRTRRGGGALAGGRASRPSRMALGAARGPVAALAWGFLMAAVALPWVALLLSTLAPVAGQFSPSGWTGRNLVRVLGMPDFREGLTNSLLLTLLTASAVTLAGFTLAFLAVRRNSRAARAVITVLGVPFSAPGTTLALVLLVGGTALAHLGVPVDGPMFLMAAAYALKYSAVAARTLSNGFAQVHPSMEEAARVSGARTVRLLATIWVPLLKTTLGAAWLLCALPMLTELTMSVLLTGPGGATLGTLLFQLQEYADQPSAAALAWILLTVALAVGFVTRQREAES
ncbi:MAG TPA: ABC transporter permease subunit, partial [Bdellovibrionota bacterium]|nr:ABC transporter permease subunit [Bdellovibrionota bacterium]